MSRKDFRRLQLIELDLIKELDRVCRKHNIKYCITCGTLLGAVRHHGYIPWDDDADIIMMREDYEKFKRLSQEGELNSNIAFFQDYDVDNNYLWGYGKLKRVGTTYVRDGQEHIQAKTGVGIDVFPLDDAPKSICGQFIQDKYYYILRKLLWAKVGCVSESGFKKIIYKILEKIPTEWIHKASSHFINFNNNNTDNRVRVLFLPAFGKLYRTNPLMIRYSMPKTWFTKRKEYVFEGIKLWGTADADDFLKYVYGDYMTLPPVAQRVLHCPASSYDFGDLYADVVLDEKGK